MNRDDKMPIMEHEVVNMATPNTAVHGGGMKKIRPGVPGVASGFNGRSTTCKLALVTVVIFLCAFVFLMLFLVTPIFFSLNHPKPDYHEPHGHDHTHRPPDTVAAAAAAAANMTSQTHAEQEEHAHEHRRRRDVTDSRRQMMLKLCGCDDGSQNLQKSRTQIRECVVKCFGLGNRNKTGERRRGRKHKKHHKRGGQRRVIASN